MHWAIASSRWIDRHLSNFISWALGRFTELDIRDYASLLHLSSECRVSELRVAEDDWVANRALSESQLRDEEFWSTFLGAPEGETLVTAGDVLILYGRASELNEVDKRRKGIAGDIKHRDAVSVQSGVVQEEQKRDPVNERQSE